MMLSLSIAGLLVRARPSSRPAAVRTPVQPQRDYRADSQQQVLHLLYGASAPRR